MIQLQDGNISDSKLHTIIIPADKDKRMKKPFHSVNKLTKEQKYDNGILPSLIGNAPYLTFQRSDRRLVVMMLKKRKGKNIPISSYFSCLAMIRKRANELPLISMAVLVDSKYNKAILAKLKETYKDLDIDIDIYNKG